MDSSDISTYQEQSSTDFVCTVVRNIIAMRGEKELEPKKPPA
jgi:hypothetical protein